MISTLAIEIGIGVVGFISSLLASGIAVEVIAVINRKKESWKIILRYILLSTVIIFQMLSTLTFFGDGIKFEVSDLRSLFSAIVDIISDYTFVGASTLAAALAMVVTLLSSIHARKSNDEVKFPEK
jgi:hypothetical protein